MINKNVYLINELSDAFLEVNESQTQKSGVWRDINLELVCIHKASEFKLQDRCLEQGTSYVGI